MFHGPDYPSSDLPLTGEVEYHTETSCVLYEYRGISSPIGWFTWPKFKSGTVRQRKPCCIVFIESLYNLMSSYAIRAGADVP